MENKHVCCFCSKEDAKYTCPRCNSLYCSKSCYQCQEHMNCSEQFYKECVEEELKLENADSDQKKQMMEILSRLRNESSNDDIDDKDSDDEDSIPDLNERLQNVDLDDADTVWNCLTSQEKQEFQAILNSGDISELIPEYEPWWCKRYEKKVVELESFLNKENEYKHICPPIVNIVPFKTLSKVQPSPFIIWNITNVLAAYALVVRRHVGEHCNSQAANTILSISANLDCNQNFDELQAAVDSVAYLANNSKDVACSQDEAALIQSDVNKILLGPENSAPAYYILSALSDLHEILNNLKNIKKHPQTEQEEFSKKYPTRAEPVDKNKLRRTIQKLAFYMSWINEFYNLTAS